VQNLNKRLHTIMKQSSFTHLENTKIYNLFHGWTGETKVKLNGKNWVLTTMKRSNGTISTHCHVVQDEGNGSFSFNVFGRSKDESFHINELPKGTKATEKTIRAAHFESLSLFDQMNENNELPKVTEEYKVEIGQILFTDGYENRHKRAVYEIDGNTFKTVLLDGSKTKIDTHVRNYKKKFGIGVYFIEGETITPQEVNDLLIAAHENMELDRAAKEAQDIINREQSKQRAEYLSQFVKADRRTTTNIIKKHVLKTWPTVSNVLVRTDVFSMGDSMDVSYTAPEKIEELERFITNFKEGSFDSMTDMYEYDSNKHEIIVEGHILQTYKYVSCKFIEGSAPAPVLTIKQDTQTEKIEGLELVDYSEKAVAVFGNTKPIKDELKNLGGRFNPNLTKEGSKVPGWIFSKNKLADLKNLLSL
jgi:hypothetical protein